MPTYRGKNATARFNGNGKSNKLIAIQHQDRIIQTTFERVFRNSFRVSSMANQPRLLTLPEYHMW
jgi:dUTPase